MRRDLCALLLGVVLCVPSLVRGDLIADMVVNENHYIAELCFALEETGTHFEAIKDGFPENSPETLVMTLVNSCDHVPHAAVVTETFPVNGGLRTIESLGWQNFCPNGVHRIVGDMGAKSLTVTRPPSWSEFTLKAAAGKKFAKLAGTGNEYVVLLALQASAGEFTQDPFAFDVMSVQFKKKDATGAAIWVTSYVVSLQQTSEKARCDKNLINASTLFDPTKLEWRIERTRIGVNEQVWVAPQVIHSGVVELEPAPAGAE